MNEIILQPYDGEAVDRAFQTLMLQLPTQMALKKKTVSALEREGSAHHASLLPWTRMERVPYLGCMVRAFEALGMQLWIVPKEGCRYPMKPLRVEQWGKDFQIVLSDFLFSALDACRICGYQLRDYVPIGKGTVYAWLKGNVQPKALALFRVLNLLGYTMEARNKGDAGG